MIPAVGWLVGGAGAEVLAGYDLLRRIPIPTVRDFAARKMIDSFLVIYRATFAVDGAGLVKMGMRLGGPRYGTLEQRWAFYQRLQAHFDAGF